MLELVNPAGLLWLGALPLLLVPYWLRQRARPRRVPALFLYRGIEKAQRVRLGGRLRLRPLFWLQLLLLGCAVAALARPLLRVAALRSALVLDNSASLAARDEGGDRFSAAKRAVAAAVDADAATIWDLYTLSPEPREVATGLSRGELRSRVDAVPLASCPHPDDGVLEGFFDQLASRGYATVHVVGDRDGRSVPPFQVTTIGSPRANVAIIDLTLVPPPNSAAAANLTVAVANFSDRARSVPITVEDAGSGSVIGGGKLDLAAGASASFATDVPAGSRVRARIATDDALRLDDEAVISAPPATDASVLLVGTSAGGLERLERALGMRVEVVAPEAYRPELGRDRALVIFHLAAPTDPPTSPALYLLPPNAPYLPPAAGRLDSPDLAFPQPTHPAVRYLNPAALRPRYGFAFEGRDGWQALAVSSRGPLLATRGSGRTLEIVSGVDLLPYVGEKNRPMSVLTLNVLSWLIRGPAAGGQLDRCVPLGPTESNLEKRPSLPIPAGAQRDREPVTGPNATASGGQGPGGEPRDVAGAFGYREAPLWPALTVLAIALVVLESWFQRRSGGPAWILRAIVLALLAVAAFDPARSVPGDPEPPLVVADVSQSVLPAVRESELRSVRRITGDAARAVAFGAEPAPSAVDRIDEVAAVARPQATDIESALALAAGEVRDGGPLVLVTDGWENRGQARRMLASLSSRTIRVYPVAGPQPIANDVGVEALSLPVEAVAGKAARAETIVRNDNPRPVRAELVIRQGEKVLARGDVKLPVGESVIARPILVTGEGLSEFSAEIHPADPATNARRDDDVAKSWVAIGGRRRLLLIGHTEHENRNLVAALTQRGFHVVPVAVADGARPPAAAGFGAVVLNDVALSELPRGFPEEAREYVHGGGSLLMVGGPRSFGLGGYRGTPIEEALPVAMKQRSREEARNSVALVIDKSGSMREERRIVFAREAARELVDHLDDRDRLTVIGFDREPFVVIPLSEVGEIRDDFGRRIDRLKPSGGTRLYPALVEARRQLLGEEAKKRHIIVLSDGLSEDAETASGRRRYYDLALALAEQQVTISTIALGRDADADFLDRLAAYGRGAFHETRDSSDLPEIVLGEFRLHARERTMKEHEFRPEPSRESPLVGEIARTDLRWPPVLGLVETELKPRARLDVAVAGAGVPLVASWEYGRGRAAAVTTDADGRWSDRWVRWSEWSRLWSGIGEWLVPAPAAESARFAIGYRDGALVIDYARFDRDPPGGVSARIVGPRGATEEIAMQRTAIGHYVGRFATRTPGDYRIEVRRGTTPVTQAPLGFTIPADEVAELPRREPNWPLLEEIAETTGGRVNPPLDAIEPGRAPDHAVPLAPALLPAAMLLFLVELVVRRLRA